MKKFTIFICIFFISALLFCGCGNKNKRSINVFNCGDYINEEVIKDFEKETGIKINYETYDTNEIMYQKLKGNPSNYDVVFPSDYMLEKMIKQNLVEKINFENVPEYKNIDDEFKNLAFDKNNEYSVPYMWGTYGIIYNTKMVHEEVTSFNILWDKKYKGSILMFDSIRDSLGISLKRLGYSMNSTNIDEINKAKEELIKQKPLVLAYVVDEVKDRMVSNEAALAVVWSGDAVTMMERNPDLKYVIPKEGSNKWFDVMAIPKGSKHKEDAEAFINFLTRPDIAKKNVEYIGYSTPNKETLKLLAEEIRNDKTAYPDKKVLDKCDVFIDLGKDNLRIYDDAWLEIKVR